jgi:hypothetical protein
MLTEQRNITKRSLLNKTSVKHISTNEEFTAELVRIIKSRSKRAIGRLFWREYYKQQKLLMVELNKDTEVAITVNSKSDNSSHDDSSRKELLWEKREEVIIEEWRQKCIKNSQSHGVKGKVMKKRYTLCSIPAILIPVVTSGLSNVLQPYPLVVSGTMIVTSLFTGVNAFFNFGSKTEQHFQYEASYMVLANEIQKELCKPKALRTACDVYLERVMNQMNQLDKSAPVL